jgi:hypothetical protein
MNRRYCVSASIALLLSAGPSFQPQAHAKEQDVSATILSLDGRFWTAYNTCDTGAFRQFFTDDVEFYHDKGGLTVGVEALIDSLQKNLCGEGPRLRREAVEGTVQVFPLHDRNVVYGAVLSGEHLFHVREQGKSERPDGRARFMDLWLLRDGRFRMARVLSYDHGSATKVDKRRAVAVSETALDRLVGNYRAPQSGEVRVRRDQGTLVLTFGNGDAALTLHPEAEQLFFVEGRDLTFEFVENPGSGWTMKVREGGTVVEEAVSGP